MAGIENENGHRALRTDKYNIGLFICGSCPIGPGKEDTWGGDGGWETGSYRGVRGDTLVPRGVNLVHHPVPTETLGTFLGPTGFGDWGTGARRPGLVLSLGALVPRPWIVECLPPVPSIVHIYVF